MFLSSLCAKLALHVCLTEANVCVCVNVTQYRYYDYLAAATATNFTFFVSSDSSAGCAKPHCVGVCGWELAVNDAMIPLMGYASDDNENTARTTVQVRHARFARMQVSHAHTHTHRHEPPGHRCHSPRLEPRPHVR